LHLRKAKAAGVSLSTVRRVESGETVVRHARQTLIQAWRNEGIEFIENGVRLIPKALPEIPTRSETRIQFILDLDKLRRLKEPQFDWIAFRRLTINEVIDATIRLLPTCKTIAWLNLSVTRVKSTG